MPGLNTEEKKHLVNGLRNYVEYRYVNRQDYREFMDHLIDTYEKAGLDNLDPMDREAFLDLVGEVL